MGRLMRGVCTVLVLLVMWMFRGSRLAAVTAVLGVAWLRRAYVTKPARSGGMVRRVGAPRWVRYTTGRVAAPGLTRNRRHRCDFGLGPPRRPPTERWW